MAAREEARRGQGLHGPQCDTVLRLGRCRGHECTAKKFSLKSIGFLKKAGSFKFGGFPECKTRNTCFIGYTKQYGITNATFTTPAGISAYAALDAGKACSKRFAISRIAVRLLLSPSCNSPAVNNQVDACGLGPTAFASGLSRMWRSCG